MDRAAGDPDDVGRGERIAKVIAAAGLCSRRDAEAWIAAGRVAVNGTVLTTPAVVVGEADLVTVDGRPLPDRPVLRLWRYHKPPGLVTTHKDPEGRPTVFAHLPAELGRLISVGRLDLTSEGLLLLTNAGSLARRLELPATGWTRRYRARAHGTIEPAALAALARGITVDGVHYGPIEARLDRAQGSNLWLTLALKEGKNREVRKVLTHLGLTVSRLIRVAYGPFQLGNLARGEVAEVSRKVLREQLGREFAAVKTR
jgi:pseudouridine synthase